MDDLRTILLVIFLDFGPLLILGGVVVGGVAIVWYVSRKFGARYSKWKIWVAGLVVVFLIPTWDVILGRIYFQTLCKKHSGARVYEQVVLPAEYWREDGSPIFLDAQGNKIKSKLGEKYKTPFRAVKPPPGPFRIQSRQFQIGENESGRLLGTYTIYSYGGGWFVNSGIGHASGIRCPSEEGYTANLLKQVFIKRMHE
jgi:hypothetical protein